MKINEIITESMFGFSWKNIGDIVRGTVVAEYLSNQMYLDEQNKKDIPKHKYRLIIITAAQAAQYREFSDKEAAREIIDFDKMDRARSREINYQSLVKTPPVVAKDGFIIDGNHRIQRAIELGMNSIPVLKQL